MTKSKGVFTFILILLILVTACTIMGSDINKIQYDFLVKRNSQKICLTCHAEIVTGNPSLALN